MTKNKKNKKQQQHCIWQQITTQDAAGATQHFWRGSCDGTSILPPRANAPCPSTCCRKNVLHKK